MRRVEELQSSDPLLLRFLLADRVSSAYALGDLDPRYSDFCRWFVSRAVDSDAAPVDAVALVYSGLRVPVLLTLGSDFGVEALLESPALQVELPPRLYAHLASPHLGAFQARYTVDALRSMVRMALSRDAFRSRTDVALTPEQRAAIEPVGHAQTAALVALYRYYPDNFFEPYQLESGNYFGIRRGSQLISVAGVHVVSDEFDVGVIGNVVTHPDHRSQGHSRRCTTRLLESLFERVSLVTLNVQRDNVAARRVYEGLGFVEQYRYFEGTVHSRAQD
jgi:ribosomal protein S18 acetylase RimI-like enzyme